MEQPKTVDAIYDEWTIISPGEEPTTNTIVPVSTLEQQIKNALLWALKNGGPPKVIKKLSSQEVHDQLLAKARSNFINKHGKKFALEAAILQDNLNFIKALLIRSDDHEFIATIFSIAISHGKHKTARYLARTIPHLINQSTLYIIKELIKKTIAEESIRPFKILFKRNFIPDYFHVTHLVNYGLEQSKETNFKRGIDFFERQQRINTLYHHKNMTESL